MSLMVDLRAKGIFIKPALRPSWNHINDCNNVREKNITIHLLTYEQIHKHKDHSMPPRRQENQYKKKGKSKHYKQKTKETIYT